MWRPNGGKPRCGRIDLIPPVTGLINYDISWSMWLGIDLDGEFLERPSLLLFLALHYCTWRLLDLGFVEKEEFCLFLKFLKVYTYIPINWTLNKRTFTNFSRWQSETIFIAIPKLLSSMSELFYKFLCLICSNHISRFALVNGVWVS